jgi:hypothetical protein
VNTSEDRAVYESKSFQVQSTPLEVALCKRFSRFAKVYTRPHHLTHVSTPDYQGRQHGIEEKDTNPDELVLSAIYVVYLCVMVVRLSDFKSFAIVKGSKSHD